MTPEINALLDLITQVWDESRLSWRSAVDRPQFVPNLDSISVKVSDPNGRTSRVFIHRDKWESHFHLKDWDKLYQQRTRYTVAEGLHEVYVGCTCREHDPAGCGRHPYKAVTM